MSKTPSPLLERSVPTRTRPAASRGARETLLCVAAVAAALVVGLGVELVRPHDRVLVLAVAIAFALATVLASIQKLARDAFSGFRFAGIILTAVGVVTMIGTFVLQGKPDAVYAQSYGGAAGALIATGVTRLFHGAWFAALLGLLAGSLVVTSIRRWPISTRNVGFFAVHLGLLLILGGAAASSVLAVRGRIDLRVGAPPATEVELTRGGARTGERLPLGFSIALDGFRVDKYESEYRLGLYQLLGEDGSAKQLATFDPDIGVTRRLPDGARVRVEEVIDDVHAGEAAGHTISEGGGPPRKVDVGAELVLSDGSRLRVVAFYPSFTFDLGTRTARSLGDSPDNPALEVTIEPPGQPARRQFLVMRSPGGAHGGRAGLAYSYAAGGGGHAEPAIVVELTDERGARRGRLVAAHRDAIFFGERKAITYEKRPEEAKSYRSRVTVAVDGASRRHEISVNAPLSVNGWSLYQSSYDPRDPTYSGIEAARDPGVPWVFAGFVLVCVGVPYMVNLAPWLRRKNAMPGKEDRP